MTIMRTRILLLTGLASLSLGACAADGAYAGGGLGFGADVPFYNASTCWDQGFYNYSFLTPYCGWYGGYFYPGSGRYVYGRDRQRHVWTGGQQNYWTTQARSANGGRTVGLGSSGGVVLPATRSTGPSGFGPGPATIAGAAPRGFGPGPASVGGRARSGFGGGRGAARFGGAMPHIGGGRGGRGR
jgi:hypothetical protein